MTVSDGFGSISLATGCSLEVGGEQKSRDLIFKFRELFREKFLSGSSPGDGPKFREIFLPAGDLAGLGMMHEVKRNHQTLVSDDAGPITA